MLLTMEYNREENILEVVKGGFYLLYKKRIVIERAKFVALLEVTLAALGVVNFMFSIMGFKEERNDYCLYISIAGIDIFTTLLNGEMYRSKGKI